MERGRFGLEKYRKYASFLFIVIFFFKKNGYHHFAHGLKVFMNKYNKDCIKK